MHKKEKMKHFKGEMEFLEIINFQDIMDIKVNKITSKIMDRILKIL